MSTSRTQFGFLPAGSIEYMLLLAIFGVIAAIVLPQGTREKNPLRATENVERTGRMSAKVTARASGAWSARKTTQGTQILREPIARWKRWGVLVLLLVAVVVMIAFGRASILVFVATGVVWLAVAIYVISHGPSDTLTFKSDGSNVLKRHLQLGNATHVENIAAGAIDEVLLDQKVGYVYLVTRRKGEKVAWRLWVGTTQQAAELGTLIRSLLKQPATKRKQHASGAGRARVSRLSPPWATRDLRLSDCVASQSGRKVST